MKKVIITEKPSVAQDFAKILGVSGKNDGYIENDKWIIKVLAVAVPISLIVQYVFGVVKNNKTEKNRKYLTLFSYSVAACIVMFPITDEIHFLIGSLISIIGLIYVISELGKKLYDKRESIKEKDIKRREYIEY